MIPTLQRIGLNIHQWLYDTTDGRIGRSLGGRPMLLLRHVGRKTGTKRTSALLYVRDDTNYAVIASKGGDPKNPAWFHNLMGNPEVDVQIGRETIPVRARVATDDERTRIWAKANDVNKGGYDQYQSKTDRKIPVVVLEPR